MCEYKGNQTFKIQELLGAIEFLCKVVEGEVDLTYARRSLIVEYRDLYSMFLLNESNLPCKPELKAVHSVEDKIKFIVSVICRLVEKKIDQHEAMQWLLLYYPEEYSAFLNKLLKN